jgi:glucose/arabinose dehydrogenase
VLFSFTADSIEFTVELIADSITIPFGIDFLPDGSLIVTDRKQGAIVLVDPNSGEKKTIQDVPTTLIASDGGMSDVLVHPDYNTNGWIYYSYSVGDTSSCTLVVERAKLKEDRLIEKERIFTQLPYAHGPYHFGGRLLIRDGYLFITTGEHMSAMDSSQTLTNHMGKVIRLFDDGRVPPDNPLVNTPNAKPEIWSYGHRNSQGLAFHPETGELWEHEHGPKGGDEINIIKPGLNYGWPVITYGTGYDDSIIGDGISEKEGMEQPLYYYKPSIGISGMLFYTGDAIPSWKGNLFVGGMVGQHLNRLLIRDNKIEREERLLTDQKRRVRTIKQGPDGFVYLGVDGGAVWRIRPAN